jgi:N-acetylmuramoyl-L-alanine amidase
LRHLSKTTVRRSSAVSLAAFLLFSSFALASPPQVSPVQQARDQFNHAQELETALNDKPVEARSRSEYLNVIHAYQRVYLITPHTGFADNALMTMARLYEEVKDKGAAVKTLNFLISEYPQTPFRSAAERDIERLEGVPERKLNAASVDNIRFWEAPNSVRVVIDLSSEVEFKQGEAKSPARVFLDLSKAKLNSMLLGKPLLVGSGLLQQIRAGQYDGSTVRVVLDVGSIGRVTSYSLKEPDRLIVDIFGVETPGFPPARTASVGAPPTGAGSAAKSSAASVPAARAVELPATVMPPRQIMAEPEPLKTAPLKTIAAASPEPPKGGRNRTAATTRPPARPAEADLPKIIPARPTSSGDRSLLRSLGLKLQRVVIDAGHGGHDTGTIGPTGYTEKELVLDVAKRLKDLVTTRLGTDVVLTRDDDTFVPLETRTAMANQSEGDLFISIHANSSRTRSVRGVETFYLNITTSREALDVAMRENAASDRSIHEQQSLIKNIMLRDKVEESRELARVIQKSMAARPNSGVDRGVKQAPFIVLIGASMPSILAEISFISNPQEEKLVKTAEYRQQIAESLFEGVRSYSESLSGLKTAAKNPDKNQEH